MRICLSAVRIRRALRTHAQHRVRRSTRLRCTRCTGVVRAQRPAFHRRSRNRQHASIEVTEAHAMRCSTSARSRRYQSVTIIGPLSLPTRPAVLKALPGGRCSAIHCTMKTRHLIRISSPARRRLRTRWHLLPHEPAHDPRYGIANRIAESRQGAIKHAVYNFEGDRTPAGGEAWGGVVEHMREKRPSARMQGTTTRC